MLLAQLPWCQVSASAALKDKEGTASSYTELLKWTKADDTVRFLLDCVWPDTSPGPNWS
jgi:hypothetical protein